MKIAILIPCYNESLTIKKVVEDYRKVLPDAEIIVYDNNSKDDTAKIALQAGATVKYENRQGKGNVIRSMFRDVEADCYLMIDGDDTYPAEDALKIVEPVLDGRADMVIGDRLSSTYFTENKRAFHNSGNKLVRLLINSLFKSKVNDIMTGYRAFSYDFVKSFPVLSSGFEIETEMTIFALENRMKLVEVPVAYRDRPEGSVSKLNTVSDGIKVLKTIFFLYKDYKPFSFFSLTALFLTLISTILFVPIVIDYIKTGLVLRFPTLIGIGFILISALLSFFSGVILDTLKKQHKQNFEQYMHHISKFRK